MFEDTSFTPQTILEVGCGSGMLTAELSRHARNAPEIIAFDNHFGSISCTESNLRTMSSLDTADSHFFAYLLYGDFRSDLFNRKFDLVVCNPPYIPLPRQYREEKVRTSDYFSAVGGLSLLRDVLASAPQLLSKDGRMLMLASNLCLDEVLRNVPSSCDVHRPLGDDGYEVLFDVEAVFGKPDWLAYLVDECGLIKRNSTYFHTLHPLWLE